MPISERLPPALLASRGGAVVLLLLLLLANGCASVESPGDEAMARGPLPYHVGIYIESEEMTWSLPQREEGERRATYVGDPAGVVDGIRESVTVLDPVVSHTALLSARNRRDALQEAKGMDLLLGVSLEVAPEFREFSRPLSWGSLEIFAWLFGGIGSWFVPSHRYETGARLSIGVIDLHQQEMRRWYAQQNPNVPAFDWTDTVEVPTTDISLHDRSSFTEDFADYVLTIFVPPTLLEQGDPERKSVALTDAVNVDLREQLTAALRERMLLEDWSKPVSIAFVSPDPNEVVEDESIALDLAIASQQDGPLRSIDVYRFAPETDVFTWRASPGDLSYFTARFRRDEPESGEPGDYVPFLLPVDVPLAPGANLIKVRVIREDGERVIRTMVYYR